MTEKIRILIADDHPVVRQGMALFLATQPDMELVAEAENGEEAVRLTQETQPDIIVMDLQMPVKDGLSAVEEIKASEADAQILVLTSFPDDDMVLKAVKLGVMGFYLKDSSPEQLVEAIRTIHSGEGALHPVIARALMQSVGKSSTESLPVDPLTAREIDVLKCLAQGMTNREIANELSVSVRTVTTYVRNILDKLHLTNRTQAALFAVEQGIVP